MPGPCFSFTDPRYLFRILVQGPELRASQAVQTERGESGAQQALLTLSAGLRTMVLCAAHAQTLRALSLGGEVVATRRLPAPPLPPSCRGLSLSHTNARCRRR